MPNSLDPDQARPNIRPDLVPNWLQKISAVNTIVFPGLKWPPFFANYFLMVILIEKWIREMNLNIDRIIELIFST